MERLVTSITLNETTQWHLREIKYLTGGRTMNQIISDALFHYYQRSVRTAAIREKAQTAAQARQERKANG